MATSTVYQPRQTQDQDFLKLVAAHLPAFVERAESADAAVPAFAVDELSAMLRCGDFEHGFLRFNCTRCGEELRVAFSCKARGTCPSCMGRRMGETAALWVDHRLPAVPYRQYVLSFEGPMAVRLGYDAALLGKVCHAFTQRVMQWLRRRIKTVHSCPTVTRLHAGVITVVQRFRSDLGLYVHLHCLVTDGVFEVLPPDVPLADAALADAATVSAMLPNTGVLDAPESGPSRAARLSFFPGRSCSPPLQPVASRSSCGPDPRPPVFRPLPEIGNQDLIDILGRVHADLAKVTDDTDETDIDAGVAACVALGLSTRTPARRTPSVVPDLNVHAFGMNLHAATTVDGRDKKQLERLARYLLRPPFAADAIQWSPEGRVRLDLPRRDRAVWMSPEQFIAKLIALVPPPRVPMVRYAGIFSNGHHLRRLVAPAPEQRPAPYQLDLVKASGVPADPGRRQPPPTPQRLAWARLLARVFAIDILQCPRCNGRLKPTGAVLDPEEIARVLHPARGPPGEVVASTSPSDPPADSALGQLQLL